MSFYFRLCDDFISMLFLFLFIFKIKRIDKIAIYWIDKIAIYWNRFQTVSISDIVRPSAVQKMVVMNLA
jgi:hypothetical protein